MKDRGRIFLIGAGPGDPGLLTRRAAQLLATADVVVSDKILSPAWRALAGPGARILDGSNRPARQPLSHDEIQQLMLDEARQGHRVARLKTGDPFVFGRGAEEALAARAAGIEFEIVPGITSAIGGPAYAGIPVTHNSTGSSVTIFSAHEAEETSSIEWESAATTRGTLVFLMGLARLDMISQKLREHGMAAATPAAVISSATTRLQRTVRGTLKDIASRAREAGLDVPAAIVVGEAAAMYDLLNWFESRPLFGRTVVVTRSRDQAAELVMMLDEAGANVLEYPTIEIAPPDSWESVDAVVDTLSSWQWLVFTSTNGVDFFFARLLEKGLDARALAGTRVAAVGATTAAQLRQHGVVADLVPAKFQSSALIPHFGADVTGMRIAVVRALVGREELLADLRARGAEVALAVAYQSRAVTSHCEELRSLVAAGRVDCVTFTSSSTVTNFFACMTPKERGALEKICYASIGPMTTETIREQRVPVIVEAREASVDSLCEAVVDHYAK